MPIKRQALSMSITIWLDNIIVDQLRLFAGAGVVSAKQNP